MPDNIIQGKVNLVKSLPIDFIHFFAFSSTSSMISQECLPCSKVCVIRYHALLLVRCSSNCSHFHLVGVVSHSKQQSCSRDDMVGDNSN